MFLRLIWKVHKKSLPLDPDRGSEGGIFMPLSSEWSLIKKQKHTLSCKGSLLLDY